MIDFFSELIDGFDEYIFFLRVVAELLLQLWCFEQFLFEVELLIEIDFMVVETGPYIVDSVSKSIELFFGDGYLFIDGVLEGVVLVGDEFMKKVYFCLGVLEEGHQEGFELELFKEEREVVVEEVQTYRDDRSHVY